MPNFLSQIIALKQKDIDKLKQQENSFIQMINNAVRQSRVAIIAEIKFASPTNPNFALQKDLLKFANSYKKAGCDGISIITEKYFFKGNQTFITKVKNHTNLPILQKDFVIDPLQIFQAKKSGADAILLIARIISPKNLKSFVDFAQKIGIEPVVEINNEDDLINALNTNTQIIAVNSRDLDTFEININKACKLLKKVPNKFIKLGFSGIKSKKEVENYKDAGAAGVLIGTSLMKAKDINKFLENIQI